MIIQSIQSPQMDAARHVAATLSEAGHIAYFAGGCVRDALLHRQLTDIDIATSAKPDEVERLFAGQTVSVGKSFGVILVREGNFSFDVATFRTDGSYADGRHPDSVVFATPEDDARRRDFTINALFQNPATDEMIDYVNGIADLKAGVVRAIGDPVKRFEEDHLRMFRAIRFATVLGFRIEEKTLQTIKDHGPWIATVSAERIGKEMTRTLCEAPKPSDGLNLLLETGLLDYFLPEAVAMKGVAQPPQFHPEGDVWTHTCLMLDGVPAPRSSELVWALLLHDIGKPPAATVSVNPETGLLRHRFTNHACIGAKMAEDILRRFHFSCDFIESVSSVVAAHMSFFNVKEMRRSKLRRYMGEKWFPSLLEVFHQDLLHSNGEIGPWNYLKEVYASFQSEPVLPDPVVKGRDLIAWGYKPSPAMGKTLQDLYDAQLEGKFSTLDEAKKFLP